MKSKYGRNSCNTQAAGFNCKIGYTHHKTTNYKFNWDSFWSVDFSQRYSETINHFQLAKANSPYELFLLFISQKRTGSTC